MSVASVGHEYHVNESTARIIHSSEDKIHASVKTSMPVGAKVSQVPWRNPLVENIERLMSVYNEGLLYQFPQPMMFSFVPFVPSARLCVTTRVNRKSGAERNSHNFMHYLFTSNLSVFPTHLPLLLHPLLAYFVCLPSKQPM